jgi:HK97 family phage major capsid protein
MAATASAKSLRENELVPLAKEIRRLAELANTEKRDFSAEEKGNWEKINKDYQSILARARALETADAIDTDLEKPLAKGTLGRDEFTAKPAKAAKAPITAEDRNNALQAWMRVQAGKGLKKRHEEACQRLKVNPQRRHIELGLLPQPDYRRFKQVHRNWGPTHSEFDAGLQARALALQPNTAGGYTVPEGFVQNLEIALLQYGGILNFADILRTPTGQDLPWPTVNDATVKGSLITENTTVQPLDTVFGQVIFHAYKYTSNLVLVPAELLEDSAFNLAEILAGLLGIRLGRKFADDFTTGLGASGPTGLITALQNLAAGAGIGVTTASPTAIAADELYTLKHSVDPAYRALESTGWMMHDQILLYIKKLKDGAGRYLWQSSLAGSRPDTIDGQPIQINQSMANAVTNNAFTIVYGASEKFKVRWVAQLRMRRLVERYADADQEGFVAFMRADSNLLDAGTHPLKMMQQHS